MTATLIKPLAWLAVGYLVGWALKASLRLGSRRHGHAPAQALAAFGAGCGALMPALIYALTRPQMPAWGWPLVMLYVGAFFCWLLSAAAEQGPASD